MVVKDTTMCGLGQIGAQSGAQHAAVLPRGVRAAHRGQAMRRLRLQGAGRRALPVRLPARAPRPGATWPTSRAASTSRPTRSSARPIRSRRSAPGSATTPARHVPRRAPAAASPVAIRALKRFVTDRIDPAQSTSPSAPTRRRRPPQGGGGRLRPGRTDRRPLPVSARATR